MHLHKNHSMKRAGEAGSQRRASGADAPVPTRKGWCSKLAKVCMFSGAIAVDNERMKQTDLNLDL
ncbi:hypothetical protein, partial [Ralstonia pseudosolanacearum]|uniref:hypothetical protein n=2 Tax=Ralstonia pseudosolanacearum TaxID=1310165 RepID=UPI001E36A05C